MRRALGPRPQKRVKADVAVPVIPSFRRWTEDDQKFKAIVCYTQFDASLGYMRRETEEEVVFPFFPSCFLLSVNPSTRILLVCPLAI